MFGRIYKISKRTIDFLFSNFPPLTADIYIFNMVISITCKLISTCLQARRLMSCLTELCGLLQHEHSAEPGAADSPSTGSSGGAGGLACEPATSR